MIEKEKNNKIVATSFKFKEETKDLLKKLADKQKRKQITVLEMLIEEAAKKEKLIK